MTSEGKIPTEMSRKRASMKAKLTQFASYLFVLESCKTLSQVQLAQLDIRLAKFNNLYAKYDSLQCDIEALMEDPDEQYSEREQFESQFYELVARARILAPPSRNATTALNSSAVSSGGGDIQGHKRRVKLPTVEIPTFTGSYQNWLEFKNIFISLVHNDDEMNNIDKLHYLRASLKDNALHIIDNLDFTADNYTVAWQLLCQRYDNKRLLINNHIQALFSVEPCQRESSKSIRHIIDVTKKNLRALGTLRSESVDHWLVDSLIIHIMCDKLDHKTKRQWEENRNSLTDSPNLDYFLTFLGNRADLLESLEESHTKTKTDTLQNKSKAFVVTAAPEKIISTPRSSQSLKCPMCRQGHHLFNCVDFRKLPASERLQRVSDWNICNNCLRPGHKPSSCRLSSCKYCRLKHNTLLHVDKEPSVAQDHNVALSANNTINSQIVLLSTAMVKVFDATGEPHSARVLLDNGSTANYVAQDFLSKLKLPTHSTSSKVTGINNLASSSTQACSITFESSISGYRISIDCLVLPEITSSIPNTLVNTHNLSLPDGICLADPTFYLPSSIDILVGAEIFWGIVGANKIQLGKNKPTLIESRLGWLISGVLQSNINNSPVCMFTQSDHSNIDLSRFWELDTIPTKHELTSEERACEESFMKSTIRSSNGQFVVTLPLKKSPDVLGNSFEMAKSRFFSLERRFERDANFKALYVDFMEEYIKLGHMTPIQTPVPHPHYYFCHHGILKESSTTTKLRAVFDGSAATTSGKSFNDIQMIGPTVQDDLLTILLRFRQHKYVVTADIEKMYRFVWVNDEQRALQLVLWRPDSTQSLKTYTLNTLTYGSAIAPYLATRCLVQLAHDSTDDNIKQSILHDFYVDDYLSGGSTVTETLQLCQGVKSTLKSAKFNLRKWHSNSKDILKIISNDIHNNDSVDMNYNELSKTLGLNWKCFEDIFYYTIHLTSDEKITKRHILSTIAQIFDPLGLVVPCIVEAKIIMQQLWINKCSWDDVVPEVIQKIWYNFQHTLPLLNNLHIPRYIVCNNKPVDIQLHVFSDASEKAYGACVYVRSVDINGAVTVRLLAAKSKIAPIKPTTLPRLELCGALLGARLCLKVKKSLRVNISDCIFWCDSTIVLGWLSTNPTQLKPFVRHRVTEVREDFGNNTWRYVPSQENPADLASRGLSADRLGDSVLWWSGPKYLQLDSSHWPAFPTSVNTQNLPELCQTFITVNENDLFTYLFNKYSCFSKLQRIMAYILRFIQNCRKININLDSLTLSEIDNSTNLLIRAAQKDSFAEEYNILKSGKSLPSKNRLLCLSPFLDSNDIIRVGGRLSNSFYDYNVKHPILMCRKSRLSELMFDMYHKKLCHAGPQLLLATVRHKYWVLGGRSLARKITRSCVKCCRIKGDTIQPIMGNLPKERLHLEFPFLDTGVDYAGPVMIASRKGRGCQLIKCFICVFVCLATRAVHLELVSDLTKEAFLAALGRFVARRGKPRCIFSDNGTTFVGAFNELKQLLSQDLSGQFLDMGINFSFIPAYSPHFGSCWENSVRSVKFHLKRILALTHLTFEEMATCLIQIEAILNSRPLTPLSDDPSDLSPLTPSHFLIGRSLVALPHRDVSRQNISSLQRFRRIEYLKQHFWNRFSNEYVLWLQQKQKWTTSRGELQPGALVVVKEKNAPPLQWLLGRVTRLLPGADGVARVADIRTRRGVIRRAYPMICPLPTSSIEDTSSRGV